MFNIIPVGYTGGPFTVTGQILAADGSASAPGYAFSGTGVNEGMYRPADSQLGWALAGSAYLTLTGDGLTNITAFRLGATVAAADVILTRDAANTLAQRNGTAAQKISIYNTYTSASVFERLDIDWAAVANTLTLKTSATGAFVRGIAIGTSNQSASGTTGPSVTLIAGNGNSTGVGGLIAITAGNGGGGANTTGGAITVTTGNAGTTASGGAFGIVIGSSATTTGATGANGGTITVTGAAGASSSNASGAGGIGSTFTLTGGDGGTASGATSSTGGLGGGLTLTAGNGGTITGTTTAIGGAGGAISITAGNGATATTGSANTAGVGGSVTITAGSAGAAGGNVAGGSVDLRGGAATGSGVIGNVKIEGATATPAGGSTRLRLLFGTTAGFGIYVGSGAPSVTAAQGSLYLRSDGSSTSTRLYVNSDGAGTWVAVTTAS